MKITVTQYHIDSGIPGDDCKCPIALACADAGLTNFVVGGECVYLNVLNKTFPLSIVAQHFIFHFDAGDKVYPFEFELK